MRLSRALLALGTAAGVLAIVARALGLWLNLSPSLPIGIYRSVRGPIVRGSIVVVCLPESVAVFARHRGYLGAGTCPGGVEPLGKTVAAVAGDTIEAGAECVRINQRCMPHSGALVWDSKSRTLRPFSREPFTLVHDELFLLSTLRPSSFDSRYFGSVRANEVRALVWPIVN